MALISVDRHSGTTAYLVPFWGALTVALSSVFLAFSTGGLASVTTESGPVEIVSALLWFGAAVSYVWLCAPGVLAKSWHVPTLFLLFAAREMDFDKRFLSEGVFKARQYSGDSPIWEKLIGLIVLALVITVLVRLVRRNWHDVISGLRHNVGWCWALATAGTFAFVSKMLDGLDRKLLPYGVELSKSSVLTFTAVEELLELAFVVLTILAICLFARSTSDQV